MNVIESLLQYIAPHECLDCRTEGTLLCTDCALRLPSPSNMPLLADGRMYAVTAYAGIGKQLVYALKFNRAIAGASDAGRCIARLIPRGEYEVVTYVPTANNRVRQRGYDQAQQIAKQVAVDLSLPCTPLLARMGSQRQVGTGRLLRRQQMSSAFQAVHIYAMHERRVLLIDDVLTTGSTIHAAARVLHAAGAQQVDAAVFAVA